MKLLCLCATMLFLVGCTTPITPTDTANCTNTCNHLISLGCEEGKPLADGTSCIVFCEKTQEAGHALNLDCVILISSCIEIEKCQVNR